MKLLLALQERPLTVSELIAQTQLEQTAASHCLRKLEQNKLVTVTREGKFRRYALNTITTKPLLAVMRKHMEAQ
jgi:DNA-binding transcriptional ArsR family regulator